MKKIQSLLFYLNLSTNFFCAQSLTPTDKLALLKGSVTNFKGKVLANETIIFLNEKNNQSYQTLSNENGNFEILIPINASYSLKYKNFTSDMEYTKMQIPDTKNATYNAKIKIDPPKEIVLNDVFFDTGKSTLKASSYKTLNDLVEILKIKNTMVVEIQGHTDNVGSEESNLKLSEARAFEVRKCILTKGIAESRIKYKGYGSTQPIAYNDSEEGRSKNRRTGLKVIRE